MIDRQISQVVGPSLEAAGRRLADRVKLIEAGVAPPLSR
jgi:hypothetical protein